jgi:putative ATPase
MISSAIPAAITDVSDTITDYHHLSLPQPPYIRCHDTIITVVRGDMCEEPSEVLVNAANCRLQHGAGIASCIVSKGGSIIQHQSNKIISEQGELPVGSVVATDAGMLHAKKILHCVGPNYSRSNISITDLDNQFISAISNIMKYIYQHDVTSVSIPAMSSGIFGMPIEKCTSKMIFIILTELSNHRYTKLKTIHLIIIDDDTLQMFKAALSTQFHEFVKQNPLCLKYTTFTTATF